jgi:hypothetical protein
MTEYDLTKEQLAETLHIVTKVAARAEWHNVLSFLEDAKILAEHLRQLQSSGAPSDPQAH